MEMSPRSKWDKRNEPAWEITGHIEAVAGLGLKLDAIIRAGNKGGQPNVVTYR